MCLSTWIYTKLFGKLIGKDEFGNSYYESKVWKRDFGRKNRWVYYKGIVEASKVPAEWFRWLHYQSNAVQETCVTATPRWKKRHIPNLTGTKQAYHPLVRDLGNCEVVGDYQAWKLL